MFKVDEKDIIFYSETFFKRFLYLILSFYFVSVLFPFIFLENSHFVVTHDFFSSNFSSLNHDSFEVYFPLDTSVKLLSIGINTLFFLILLFFVLLLIKKRFVFKFSDKKIIFFYFLSSFIVFFVSILSIFYKNQLVSSIYTFSILISNLCFYFSAKIENKKFFLSIFLLNAILCVIIKGIIIDGGVFNALIFLLFFILFNNLSKKIFFLSILIVPFIFSSFYILKIYLMKYKSNLYNFEQDIIFSINNIDNCENITLNIDESCSIFNVRSILNSHLVSLDSLKLKNFNLDEKIYVLFFNKEKNYLEKDFISHIWSKKRNNLVDGSELNNYFLSYYALIINKIIIRFDLNSSFYRAITFHKEFPDLIKFSKGESYKPLKTKIIPRKFLDNKPKENYGNIFGKKYGFISDHDNETTINLSFLLEGYINYGYNGLFIPYLSLILFLSLIYLFLKTISKNLFKFNDYQLFTLFLFAQLIFFLIIIETNLSLIFGRFLYLNFILLVFVIVEKYFFKIIKNVN